MTTTATSGVFLLIGIDADGEKRESTHGSLEEASAVGRQCSKQNGDGRAWKTWEVWGNHPQTGEWLPLLCSVIAKFRVGRIVATPNALSRLTHDEILIAIGRHQAGDWGNVDEHDRCENETSLIQGLRLMSVYHSTDGTTFWVITEADRSATTVLMPEDY